VRKFTLNDLNPPSLMTTPVNRVIFINDRSGSMNGVTRRLTEDVQGKIEQLKKSDAATGQKSLVTIWDFDNHNRIRCAALNEDVKNLNYSHPLNFDGGTALNDAVYTAIDAAKKYLPLSSDESFLVLIFTDGGECSSIARLWKDVRDLISTLGENWTITLIGPAENMKWGADVGIPRDNMLPWDGSATTFAQTVTTQSVGLGNYVSARSKGTRSVANFYTVDPNKIQDHEVKGLIQLGKNDFALVETQGAPPARVELAPMVKAAGFAFKTGVNYYELLKPEKIQEDKDLLVMDENGNVYGKGNSGEEIRRALGLPTTGTITVRPMKGKYKIFVQSNSNNRKMIAWADKTTGEVKRQKLIILL